MANDERKNLGPLGVLLGTWEGETGDDLAPSAEAADNRQPVTSKYRERMVFEPTGRVDNHEQALYGLRYRTTAWRLGADDPFHEEVGYWLWDADAEQIMRSFMPPRGMAILAGGSAKADATSFELVAELGSETFGICSSPFLTREFKTVRYELKVVVDSHDAFRYEENTQMKMKDREALFDHRDSNALTRLS